jgi:hypothetical protein
MGVGFIQLITQGYGYNILNKDPQITFFKIYYRRHTNFFINNYEIEGNYLKDNSLLTFNIPKNGDYLSKSYLRVSYEENFTEILREYPSLYSTLFIDILNSYNSFSVRVNTFNKDQITNMKIAKVNFINNDITYLSILCTHFINEYNAIEIFKSENNLVLETDNNNFFYNINQYYSFYGFDMITNSDIINNNLILYLFNQIDFDNLTLMRIDIVNYKTSFRIQFDKENQGKYLELFNSLISNYNILTIIGKIKIDKNSLYISFLFNNTNILNLLYNNFIQSIFENINLIYLEIINNKIKSNKYTISDDVFNKILKIVSNIDSNYIIYYDIFYNSEFINMILFTLKDTPFFGNLITNDFNELLIKNETQIINTSNLSDANLSINLYIRIIISLVCDNIISIQEFIRLVNQKQFDFISKINSINPIIFNKKILDIIINPNILIISKSLFKKILYQNNVKNNYENINQITPFTNRKISSYQSIIVNFYLYFNILAKFSNRYNQTYDSFNQFLEQLIGLSSNNINNSNNSNILKQTYFTNYIYNNNIFDFVLENTDNNGLIIYKNISNNFINKYIENLIFNSLMTLITESINIIENIYLQKSYNIYLPNGLLSNLFYNMDNSTSVFPFSSSIFIYSQSLKDLCLDTIITISSSKTIFNESFIYFNTNLFRIIKKNIEQDFNLFKTNFNDSIELDQSFFINNFLLGTELSTIINNYYINVTIDENKYNNQLIKDFLYELTVVDFNEIIPNITIPFSINSYIMENLFKYTDNYLYNNSFSNYTYNKQVYDPITKECSYVKTNFIDSKIYLNFIFTINSPIYRIYFLFTYFAYMSLDPNFKDIIPNDLIVLRDLTFKFINEFIRYFNNINNILVDQVEQFNTNYDVSLILNNKYNLINNFLCFDQIDLLKDSNFTNILSLNPDDLSKSLLLMYQSFYFNKELNPLLNTGSSIQFNSEIINKFISQFKYNYDDKIIIVFLETLDLNKSKFKNFDLIYNLVNLFFDKTNIQYNKIIENIILIFIKYDVINSISDFKELTSNQFYYSCYYTIYSIGTIFDNIDLNNLNVINNTFNLTLGYNKYSYNNNFYSIKSNDIKQFVDYLDNSNILNAFKNIYSSFNSLLLSYNILGYKYYLEIINNANNYITRNFTYLLYYSINEIVYNQCLNKILIYIDIFNNTNNTNIQLLDNKYYFTNKSFIKKNIICILLLYISFLNSCLSIDVNTFISIKNITIENNFNNYVKTKYSINIYTECLNDLIIILSNGGTLISLDYNTIYTAYSNEVNIENELIHNDKAYYLSYMEKIFDSVSNDETTYKILYDLFNKSSFINVNNNLNKSSYLLFYSTFNNNLNNYVYQYNKILYSLLNNSINNKTIIVNNISEVSIQEEYINILKILYNNSVYIIQNNIYNNLKIAYSTTNILDQYSQRIVNNLINTVKYFYDSENNNYYHTIYFKKCIILNEESTLDNIINKTKVNSLNNIDNIIQLIGNYVNINIFTSIFYEKELNRLLYLFATNFAITKTKNKQESIEYLKKQTLYNIVKLYSSTKSVENTIYREYKINNYLYSDIDIFELFNYQNWSGYIAFIQNKWANVLVGKLDTDVTKTNSFYYYFNSFRNFCILNIQEILLFKLTDGTPVLNYFADILNINELHDYIFNLMILADNFSPNDIFNSIIKLRNNYEATSFMEINTDNIKKKIIIYLFFNYIVLSSIHILLIENFNIDKTINFEYDIIGQKINFNVTNILNPINLNTIYYYISNVYSLDDDNINKLNYNLNIDIENYYEIIYITENAKKTINIKENFIILIKKYISSFELIIGNDNLNTDSLAEPSKGITISNVVKRINIVFNNDTNLNNILKYNLTIESIKLLDINISNTIYDLNNIYYNTNYPESTFISNNYKYFLDTDISNINIIFNFVCVLLKYYNITYKNLNTDVNSVIGNLRLAGKYINDALEIFKGLSTNYQISYNLTSYSGQNSLTPYENSLTRYNNINTLSTIAFDLNNLSIITPCDYDLEAININYQKIYLDLYKKYYYYDYNYYNFKENYTVIYPVMLTYYNNIINNSQALVNLQKNKIDIYKKVFNQIIDTFLANQFYSSNSTYPLEYLTNYNNIISLFKQFNFTFKINKNNTSNVENLALQNFFNTNVQFSTYTQLYEYLISLYYYMLLSDKITIDATNSNFDLVVFLKIISIYENFNQQYELNFINIIYRIKLSIQLVVKIIEFNLNISLNFDSLILDEILIIIINLISKKSIISNFIYTYNIKYQKQFVSVNNIYDTYVNIVEYNEFITLLSKSIKEAIFYTNNKSIEYNVLFIWEKYWKNTTFEYYDYTYNNYEIKLFTLDFNNFFSTVREYLIYIYQDNNSQLSNDINNILGNYFSNLFRIKIFNNTYNNINFEIIFELIFERSLDITGTRDLESNYFSKTLINILTQTTWGIIFYNNINNTINENLNAQILFNNFYYAYVDYYNLNPNFTTTLDTFNYKDFINTTPKLQILYRIISKVIVNQFIDSEIYYNIFNSILLNCHKFVYNGELIQTLNLPLSTPTFLDFFNKNLIKDNIINNFYKTIQDSTIKDIISYKINTFLEQEDNLDNFSINIYNKYINQLQINSENNISLSIINNTIIGIINNYNSDIDISISIKNSSGYFIKCIKYILQNIKINLDIYKSLLGGDSNKFDNIYLNTCNIFTMFDGKAFTFDESIITIFTLIYNRIENFIDNDLLIILFYYNCYITWLSTYGNNYSYNLDKITYDFANLINVNIIKYIDYINNLDSESLVNNLEFIKINNFFNGLNEILFGVYNDLEYINICQRFFNNHISNYYNITQDQLISNLVQFNIKTFNGNDFVNTPFDKKLIEQYYYTKVSNNYILNNKLNVWKYLLGICVDINNCEIIKQMKSIYETNPIINIQNTYIQYIKEINGGYINQLGILKIFEYFNLNFDDELIDTLNKQMYKIFVNLNVNLNQYKAIEGMLGLNLNYLNESYLTNGLTSWIIKMSPKNFYIPLNFFFKDNANAIPLIACMYTNIKIEALFNSRNIFKDSLITNILKPFNVTTGLNMDFIFVERDERKIISTSTIDNLIETHGNYIKTINFNNIVINPYDDTIILEFEFEINALVKEIIWELTFYLDSLKITPSNHKKINQTCYNIYDFILNTKFYIDGARRDGVTNLDTTNNNSITTYLNPYRYNTRANSNNNNNLNVYSFALEPEEFQPTGAINLNLTKIFSIQITMDKNALLKYITNTKNLFDLKKLTVQINLTTIQYNLVRYQSGLSGLLFVSNNSDT